MGRLPTLNGSGLERIQPREKKSLENLAAYLIRATFSHKRMEYSPEQAAIVNCSCVFFFLTRNYATCYSLAV
jgi:hypothetical protein